MTMPPVTADVGFDCPRCFCPELHGFEDDEMVWIECAVCGWMFGVSHEVMQAALDASS